MIITCEKCSKKFDIDDKLIPKEGRKLQCGSCGYEWYFGPIDKPIKLEDNTPKEAPHKNKTEENYNVEKIPENQKKIENEIISTSVKENKVSKKIKKDPKIIKNFLVLIITLVALIIFLDTFKNQLGIYLPGLDFLLNNLYESIKDLSLFFKDLIN